jgi:hypothetical protein
MAHKRLGSFEGLSDYQLDRKDFAPRCVKVDDSDFVLHFDINVDNPGFDLPFDNDTRESERQGSKMLAKNGRQMC